MVDPGTLLGDRYRVRSSLARGGMSEVFVARDELLDRDVAIKVIRGDTGDRRRFESEIALLARLDHPLLVKVYDVGEEDGEPFVVMELVSGTTLAALMREGPLDEARALRLAADLSDSLAYLHRLGVVHRDVKPSNILLDDHGHTRLADFGIARLVDTNHLTLSGTVMGSPSYVAPEQIAGDESGPPADIYSLGLVLAESLTGRRPFDGNGVEVTLARLDHDPDVLADVPPRWRPLITAMTARDPSERPTADEVHDLVGTGLVAADDTSETVAMTGAVLAETAVLPAAPAAVADPVPVPPDDGTKRSRAGWALAALAVLVVLVVVALASQGGDGPELPAKADTSTSAPTTVAGTAPATTVAPATAAPVATDCASLQQQRANVDAQRKLADQQSKGAGPAGDAAKRALDQQKHDLDAALKQCH